MSATDILKLVPTMQASSLALRNLRLLKKRRKSGDFIKQGMENIVGTSLIKEQAKFIGGM